MTVEWETTMALRTDAGMFALWQPEAFTPIDDVTAWEDRVADPRALSEHIGDGTLVPVNIGGDGAFGFTVRVGRGDLLSEREREYVVVSSQGYRLDALGPVMLTGLEAVGTEPTADARVELRPGQWAVVVHLLDWSSEPGAADEDGDPREGALSDFVLQISPAEGGPFRQDIETFERPE